ncbi:MAG: sigma-70 family RNA polymerase sigma factor [Lachnospiraceae bacterium]|nr:sigma-70 family RNA polymerase sigma factor [Lachnospiraceae bacterium]
MLLTIYLSALNTEEDRCLFQTIYEQNTGMMYHAAIKIIHNSYEAENAVHAAFLSLAEHFDTYKRKPRNQLDAICVSIAKNKALDALRRQRHLTESELEEILLVHQDTRNDPANLMERNDESEQIRSIMDQLPEILRIVLELKYYCQYSNPEIARILDISLKVVEMRLYRAKIKLRELMKNETQYP